MTHAVAQSAPSAQSAAGNGVAPGTRCAAVPVLLRLPAERRAAVLRHLLALDDDDRYLRFGYTASDAVVTRHVAGLDFTRDIMLAIGDPERGFLIGVAHVALMAPHAEFGLSVLPQWRCRGYGRWLFIEAMRAATAAGMRSVDCITGNASVLKMARENGFVVRLSQGEPRATLFVDACRLDVFAERRGIVPSPGVMP